MPLDIIMPKQYVGMGKWQMLMIADKVATTIAQLLIGQIW
jgi:hypothetical protein